MDICADVPFLPCPKRWYCSIRLRESSSQVTICSVQLGNVIETLSAGGFAKCEPICGVRCPDPGGLTNYKFRQDVQFLDYAWSSCGEDRSKDNDTGGTS